MAGGGCSRSLVYSKVRAAMSCAVCPVHFLVCVMPPAEWNARSPPHASPTRTRRRTWTRGSRHSSAGRSCRDKGHTLRRKHAGTSRHAATAGRSLSPSRPPRVAWVGGGRAAPQPGKRRAGRCTTPGSAADDTHIDIRGLSPSLAPAPRLGAPRPSRSQGAARSPSNVHPGCVESEIFRSRVFPKRCMLVCVNRRRTRFRCALTDAGVRRLLTHTKIVFGVC